ncbi:MAG: LysM peptidoglycan-binding domain-containing protein [Calditrichaceae bacterium]|nr:LysM peptidoglycan-binding domain-containing protein [Calditrichaceae bacterium]MBN2708832.1 LysM peptidoglycan-binding domain-containing protein [Calditrichaceae bacterium]RQV97640.1 MAG: LysM peptidoglycan-binding domain-containing protein [Calditrichota bacterium]
MRKALIIYSIIWLSFSCQPSVVKEVSVAEPKPLHDFPENLWISKKFETKIDTIFKYHDTAKEKLAWQDTLGAEIYFSLAFDLVSGLNDEDRTTLQYWAYFDSVFKFMTDEYEKIYFQENLAPEAEEIREEIADFEDFYFSDSLLYSDETLVDSSSGFPITLNKKVRLAIQYFQTRGRAIFTRWLERSGKYEDITKAIFKEIGLPEELVYVAMIESGFNPNARSYARAVGMWQFISATGRYYDLRNNWWFDERRDVIKASYAAARHLKDLYERFGDWYLALSGYNCNPKKVEYNMRCYNTRDFWQLKRLPRQTRNYVPTFLAATIIAKNPRQFGFYVEKEKPVKFDSVVMSESVDLNVIARLTDTTYSCIRDLNPSVLRWVTPPGISDFNLYLPAGTKEKFELEYAEIPESDKRSWVRHHIRSGETLSTIAAKYRTDINVIKSVNKLRGVRITAGDYLLIPVPQNHAHYYSYKEPYHTKTTSKKAVSITQVQNVPGSKKVIYIVKKGDTLGQIAEDFNTRASRIRSWNGLRYGEHIYPNQKLNIWVAENLKEMKAEASREISISQGTGNKYYTVKKGDTLWDISRKHNISVNDLKYINNKHNSSIRPGDRLKVSKH